MKLALVTDAWHPQVNGVVTTLVELVQGLVQSGVEVLVLHPGLFQRRPCPGYPGIDLAIRPYRRMQTLLDEFAPDAVHLATEGPLGWAGRKSCLRRGWAFSSAFHTKFPEILHAALRVPLWLGYAVFRHFHRPSSAVMVPTQGVLQMLQSRGFRRLKPWTHGVDTDLFAFQETPQTPIGWEKWPRPYWLYVGRISYEKNIDAFLALDLPGTRIVCGVGPLEKPLRQRHPDVVWMGVLPRAQLAQVYGASDVFVFPSRHETFGLVMLEAMACGTPVAAYPVDGPLEVMGATAGSAAAGVLSDDLAQAATAALQVPRQAARERALAFGWTQTVRLFHAHLVPVEPSRSPMLSRKSHICAPESAAIPTEK